MGTTNPARVAASQFSGTNQFTNLVPEAWVKELLMHFDANRVFKKLVNFKYEKTIKGKLDTVHIRKIGRPSIQDYERNGAVEFEDMTNEKITFTIDQQKAWAIKIDDLDVADMDIDILEKYVEQAAIALAIEIDEYIEDLLVAGADEDNVLGADTPVALTKSNIYDTFVDYSVTLTNTNTVPNGKLPSIVVPTAVVGLIRKSPEAKDKSTSLGDKVVRTGDSLGEFGGLEIIPSRKMTAVDGVYTLVALTSTEACTFAMKVSKLERVRLTSQGKFANGILALYFYGGKVIYPEMVGLIHCTVS